MGEKAAAFLKVLDPNDNSTGGGTASALAGAMAAALVAMVARLSLGKRGLESDSFYRRIAAEARELSRALFSGGGADSEAFERVKAARALPAGTDREKAARRAAIQQSMLEAARVPLENAELCRQVQDRWRRLQGRANPKAASDLQCAGYLARAALLGCLANVEINLPYIEETSQAEALAKRVHALRAGVSGDSSDRSPGGRKAEG